MIDHSNCDHPRTPAGRRACRAKRAADTDAMHGMTTPPIRESVKRARGYREHIRGLVDPKPVVRASQRPVETWKPRVAPQPPRKPRRLRSVALNDPYGDCVQAALHRGTGRCACGWSNPVGWRSPV